MLLCRRMMIRKRRCFVIVLGILVLFALFRHNFRTVTNSNGNQPPSDDLLVDISELYEFSNDTEKDDNFSDFSNFTVQNRRNLTDRGRCLQIHGKVVIFLVYTGNLSETIYKVAQQSLQCYLKGTDYQIIKLDINKDERVQKACGHHQLVFFQKHCAAAEYLKEGDWMLVLDADTGVINPNHCIEEWIDPRVNLIFYERFFNWEIASGNYIARNSAYSYNFLKAWADYEFHAPKSYNGYDNGALQIVILKALIPDAIQEAKNCEYYWSNANNADSYMAFVTCVKLALGATRLWPGKIRIYRRAHGWVRDRYMTQNDWGPSDFMIHGWKNEKLENNPFEREFKISECGEGTKGWSWVANKSISDDEVRGQLNEYEKWAGRRFPKRGRVIPYLKHPDVGKCYPNCEEETDRI